MVLPNMPMPTLPGVWAGAGPPQATRLPTAVLPHQANVGGGEHLAVYSDSLGALPMAL